MIASKLASSLRRLALTLGLTLGIGSPWGVLAAEPSRQTIGRTESNDPRVPTDARIEVLESGFTWTEGPLWIDDDAGGHLLFSDIPRNTIYRWSSRRGCEVFMSPSGYTGVKYYGLEPGSNGLALNPAGDLCMCEHGDRRVSMLTPGGGKVTLVDRYRGKRLNSPNDLVFAKDGTIYFTDPPYGLPRRENDPMRELDFCGVYRLDNDGSLTLLTDSIERPNGIGLSADESRLIVAQSNPDQPNWTVFDIRDDGTLSPGREIAEASAAMKEFPGLPDGLVVGPDDTIYASGPGGIYVMDFEGKLLGRFITGKRTSNATLDRRGHTLYVTADDTICRVRLRGEAQSSRPNDP